MNPTECHKPEEFRDYFMSKNSEYQNWRHATQEEFMELLEGLQLKMTHSR